MTSKDTKTTIYIKLCSNVTKKLLFVMPHLMILMVIIACVILFKLPLLFLVFSVVVIFVSYFYFTKLHLKKDLKNSVLSLYNNKNEDWYIDLYSRTNLAVEISGESFFNEFFIIVKLIDSTNKQFTALITKDCVDSDQYRKLKIFINTHKFAK